MNAIKTKYRGPTDRLCSRVVASEHGNGRKTVAWDHSCSEEQNHRIAAQTFAEQKHGAGSSVNGRYLKPGEWVWFVTPPVEKDKRPYCAECGCRDVETVERVRWNADGTSEVTDYEPYCSDAWCPECGCDSGVTYDPPASEGDDA